LDLGIIGSVNGFNKNFGWKLENLVYLDLLKKYEYVYTYKNKNGKQIDFICINDSIITYIQVTKYLVPKNEENSNWDREIGVLASIRDSNRKICICFENETERLDNGIEIINILDWL
jgi:predicted AAA+ superfamily ATPase